MFESFGSLPPHTDGVDQKWSFSSVCVTWTCWSFAFAVDGCSKATCKLTSKLPAYQICRKDRERSARISLGLFCRQP